MKNKSKILVPLVLILSLNLIGCGVNSEKKLKENAKNSSKVETYDLIKYKDTYVGDNSSVGSIIKNLPANEYSAGFSLQTTKEPYEITVNYKTNENLGKENYNKFWNDKKANNLLEKNAVVLLYLISNAEIIKFNVENIGEESYKYDRKNLEQKYGNLRNLFKDNDSLNKFLNN
ncbi:hypothetical protein A0J52_07170 [Clostridium sporogenes]|uniref:DUF4825 domain-containing protein n=1 Tax=Clostridium sporogenes TaxID=1509 RepID=A0A7X5SXU7_CLOSG|nr:DUF4825 domain-containing protein [Clostridium sporogenes]AJD29867.1 hypothetical protein T258_982 [Clostridium botulinum Prevot_594]KOY67455.1 hypothetical protein AN649_03475 [Clostridium sporogenes]KRU42379.1 hypothetical protein VT94_16050 [Clostridium sporogenes]KYN79047.1 hypothetical protein A0J52_07170 [Clostridium sporogenes]MBW5457148.1 DUF4825 domain-containing protein [Clostridium sporogenes]